MTYDYGLAAHNVAVEHLEACFLADEMGTASPAIAPFDGCLTCITREVIYAAWPTLYDAVIAGVRPDRPRSWNGSHD